jgi:hypothetical protein
VTTEVSGATLKLDPDPTDPSSIAQGCYKELKVVIKLFRIKHLVSAVVKGILPTAYALLPSGIV